MQDDSCCHSSHAKCYNIRNGTKKKHPETMESGAFDAQLYKIIDECGDFILVLPAHALDRCVENYCI